jgi:hypothetical protein
MWEQMGERGEERTPRKRYLNLGAFGGKGHIGGSSNR